MELVEGPTLAERIAQGPIALDEALPIARQVAGALEAAHETGIIHHDLKPANIKITPAGTSRDELLRPTSGFLPSVPGNSQEAIDRALIFPGAWAAFVVLRRSSPDLIAVMAG